MTGEHTFHEGLMASALNFGPDGGLYIADWDGMWTPNQRGAIYRVDDPSEENSAVRRRVADLLRNDVHGHSTAALCRLLGHADVRIRRLAQFELVRREEGLACLNVVRDTSASRLARVHAIWSLLQMRGAGLDQLPTQLPWQDRDEEVRAQVAKFAGDLRLIGASEAVRTLLRDPSPRVRFHAAIASGKLGDDRATRELFEMVRQNANRDPMLRHAAIMGLTNAAAIDTLVAARNHHSVDVRSAAVVALRRRKHPGMTAYLTDRDPWVRREAAAAIHDDFSREDALAWLAERVGTPIQETEPAIIRRAISANFRLARMKMPSG